MFKEFDRSGTTYDGLTFALPVQSNPWMLDSSTLDLDNTPSFEYDMSDVFAIQVPQEHVRQLSCCACAGCGEKTIQESTFPELGDFSIPAGAFGAFGKAGIGDLSNTVPGDSSTTATIEVGGRVSGTRDNATDSDWYQVELVAGQEYTFMMLRDGANPHEDPLLKLIGTDGVTVLEENDDVDSTGDGVADNRNSAITYTATETGTFYLAAEGWENATGDYTIFAEEGNNRPDFSLDEVAFFLTDQFDNAASWITPNLTYDVSNLPPGAQTLAILAMEAWAEVSGLTFSAVTGNATASITFDDIIPDDPDTPEDESLEQGAYAAFGRSGSNIVPGNIVVTEDWTTNADGTPNYDLNSYRYQTYLHEVGHALGLGHGGPYNGGANYATSRAYNQDAWNYTVMSYFDQGEAGNGTPRLVLGLQLADILAVQNLYGTNAGGTRDGDSVYGFNVTADILDTVFDFENTFDDSGIRPPSISIYDTGGEDTLDFSGYSANQEINLVQETFSSVGDNTNTADATEALINLITIARDTVIENAMGGTGDDTITGNAEDNELTGGEGDDILVGGEGTDFAIFNGVRSNYTITDNGDGTFTVTANSGDDGSDTLSGIEFAKFTDQDFALSDTTPVFTANDDNVIGTEGDDILDALGGNDTVNGLGGNDTIFGRGGDDTLIGGLGNDALNGNSGNDTLDGGAGNDFLNGRSGIDTLTGGLGDDRLVGDSGNDVLSGGDGVDTLFGGLDDDEVNGDAGNDFVYGNDGNDVLRGGLGNDVLEGGSGTDEVFGNEGNDFILGDAGVDSLYGGAGEDRILGGEDADTILGGTENDTVFGGLGDDNLYGESGNDFLRGGDGIDFVNGGDGDDRLIGDAGDDRLIGEAGDDDFFGGDGNDELFGGDGADFMLGNDDADLIRGGGDNDSIYGGNGVDRLYGDDGDDFLRGGNDNDTIEGGAGLDRLIGDNGNDILRGGASNDTLFGGDGDDNLFGDNNNDTLYGNVGDDQMYGGNGADILYGQQNNDLLSGGGGNDQLFGGTGNDDLIGANGDDRLLGEAGDDMLSGGAGLDDLFAGAGNDILNGGAGNDLLFGGTGSDTFVFSNGYGYDRVRDFELTNDVVDLLGTSFTSYAQIEGAMTDGNGFVLIDINGTDTLRIDGVQSTDLNASHFNLNGNATSNQPKDDLTTYVNVTTDVDTSDMELFSETEDTSLDAYLQNLTSSSMNFYNWYHEVHHMAQGMEMDFVDVFG